VVLAALYRISKKSLKTSFYWVLAGLAFVALFFMNLPFPLVVIGSGVLGVIYGKFVAHHELADIHNLEKPPLSQTIRTVITWVGVWFAPIFLTIFVLGPKSTMHTLNLFFSKMAMVTFGGAYAALSYVAQQAVDVYGWLQGGEMLDGLALAETTPAH
jgi:chromate transporter